MANVFLSYAREDSARAAIIAKALSRRWTVWWDRTIPPGKTFDDVIEDALDRAACVVVLWSRTSVLSHWVRSEAAEGARRGILVPAFLEAAKIPLEFRRVQAANLTSWNGDPADPEFEQFIRSISTLIEAEAPTRPPIASPRIAEPTFDTFASLPRPAAPEQRQATQRRSYAVAGVTTLAIVATIGGGVAWWATPRKAAAPPATETPDDHVRTTPPESNAPPVAASDPRIDVPSIVGLRMDAARMQLERIGLSVGSVHETNDGSPAGTISAQRPAAGERVSPGAAVELVVATAAVAEPATTPRAVPAAKSTNRVAQGIEVPDLTGLTIDEARDRVARRGLTIGSVSGRSSDKMPADTVLSQEPPAGTRMASGMPVSLVIADAPRVDPPSQVQPR